VVARRHRQAIDVTWAVIVFKMLVRMDDRMANLNEPVMVAQSAKVLIDGTASRTIGVMSRR